MPRFVPMPYPATAAVFAAVFAAGTISSAAAHAQETPPTAPPAPAAPATPVVPPASPTPPATSEEARAEARIAAEAYRKAMEQSGKALAETLKTLQNNKVMVRGYGYPANTLFGTTRLPSKTINVDLKNVSARDAIVKVLDEAKLDYVIDEDFPKDAKLSLSISGVQVSTALDLITQSAGVHWAAEKRDNKTIVRVGKTVKNTDLFFRYGDTFDEGNGLSFSTTGNGDVQRTFVMPPLSAVMPPLSAAPAPAARPLIYQYRTTEQRSTFTCPKCGKKSTVVQKNGAKAGDSTAHDDWHFCPFCGKKVSATQNAAPLWEDNDNTFDYDAPETTASWLPSLPTQDGIISEPDVFIAPDGTK